MQVQAFAPLCRQWGLETIRNHGGELLNNANLRVAFGRVAVQSGKPFDWRKIFEMEKKPVPEDLFEYGADGLTLTQEHSNKLSKWEELLGLMDELKPILPMSVKPEREMEIVTGQRLHELRARDLPMGNIRQLSILDVERTEAGRFFLIEYRPVSNDMTDDELRSMERRVFKQTLKKLALKPFFVLNRCIRSLQGKEPYGFLMDPEDLL